MGASVDDRAGLAGGEEGSTESSSRIRCNWAAASSSSSSSFADEVADARLSSFPSSS